MEGVEDIPGSALVEGITWEWTSFPEFLDALERKPHVLNIGTQIAHGALRMFERPFLCAFGDSDPVTKGGDAVFIRNVPGAAGQAHTTIISGGHFIQEDKAPELANIINSFIATTTLQ